LSFAFNQIVFQTFSKFEKRYELVKKDFFDKLTKSSTVFGAAFRYINFF